MTCSRGKGSADISRSSVPERRILAPAAVPGTQWVRVFGKFSLDADNTVGRYVDANFVAFHQIRCS